MKGSELMQGVEIGDLVKVINGKGNLDFSLQVGEEYFVCYTAPDHIAVIVDYSNGNSRQAYIRAGQFIITKKVTHDS